MANSPARRRVYRHQLLHSSMLATTMAFATAVNAQATTAATSASSAPTDVANAQVDASGTKGPPDAPAAVENKQTGGADDDAIVVRGVRFQYEEATSVLKVPLSLKDTPQTVLAVTQDVIDFASIKTFDDVYKIDADGGTSHAQDSFPRNYYRGFRQQGNDAIKIDGFRMPADVQLDLAPYERFEVVKGATSTMYGQNSVAGTLNAISKMPKDQFGGSIEAEAGSYDHYRGTFDVYGPLTSDGKLMFRVVGAILNEKSFVNLAYKRTTAIVPELEYKFDENTYIVARVNYQIHHYRYDFGTGLYFTGSDISQAKPGDFTLKPIPYDEFFGQRWNRATKKPLFAQTEFDHKFDNGWMLRMDAQYNKTREHSAADSEQAALSADGSTLYSALYTNEKEDELYAGEIQLYGDVDTFGSKTTIFLGTDYYHEHGTLLQGYDDPVTGFNIFHPDYDLIPAHSDVTDYPNFYNTIDTVSSVGFTGQVFFRPFSGLTLLLGGRFSHEREAYSHKQLSIGDDGVTDLASFQAQPFDRDAATTNKFTVQLGTTYAITKELNAYASYGTTFQPQVGTYEYDPTNPLGKQIAPEQGKAYEVGLKGEFLKKKVLASVALFNESRTNIAQYDPQTHFDILLGKQNSKGIEFEVQGQITHDWNLFLSAALMKAEFKGGNFDGLTPTEAPRFGLSIFTTYQLHDGPLSGLGVGGGVVHKGGRKGFGTDLRFGDGSYVTFNYGAFTEADARIFYDFTKHWRIQFGVTNFTNDHYWSPAKDRVTYGINPAPPREVLGKLTYSF